MMAALVFVLVTLALAYANGANDNFKGVATLFGSRTTNYRTALWWATVTTLAGSLAATVLATRLITVFSGKGLVPNALTPEPTFLLAVGLAAAATVFLATVLGLPISTTHALIGALVGTGLAAVGPHVDLARLGQAFFLPLAVSPLLACTLAAVVYPVFRWVRLRLGVQRTLCVCLDGGQVVPVAVQAGGTLIHPASGAVLTVGELRQCVEQYRGVVFGLDCQWLLDHLHYLSAGAVSVARGLNDTPKIVALLVATQALAWPLGVSAGLVGLAMAVGGLLSAQQVAITMSERITGMNHGQGFTANLCTAALVILASRWGLPVSTTHVSCGALIGIGATTRQARWHVVRAIVLAWVGTLPLAGLLGACGYAALQMVR